jgi:hypothetical protein
MAKYFPNRSAFQYLTFSCSIPSIPNTPDKYLKLAPYTVNNQAEADVIAFMLIQKFIGEIGMTFSDQCYDQTHGSWWVNSFNNKNQALNYPYSTDMDIDMENNGSTTTEYFRMIVAVNKNNGNGYFVTLQRGLYANGPLWAFNVASSSIALDGVVFPGAGLRPAGTGWGQDACFLGTHELAATSPWIMDGNGALVVPYYVELQLNQEE